MTQEIVLEATGWVTKLFPHKKTKQDPLDFIHSYWSSQPQWASESFRSNLYQAPKWRIYSLKLNRNKVQGESWCVHWCDPQLWGTQHPCWMCWMWAAGPWCEYAAVPLWGKLPFSLWSKHMPFGYQTPTINSIKIQERWKAFFRRNQNKPEKDLVDKKRKKKSILG